ncbi:rare lipoprotein A [Candidatus Kryptobacter tengchongensis]|uniref:Probable endolytic peptidoglycan transglycosylase RlpA n=1 Tax=Kryptobacter tengchongensis TaxID=1643429 RepID=A0A656D2J1_KRYT1|nr:rare lipoprotein A [Candidatus Kryptobacter tengchongensis]CUS97551.1 rare lipoprotein A [Candidatus Kryptobacter tengchongensis]CUT04704.1 rare lipoprotein A [Candidatus Kryptobacter tengchongensis]CUU08590.1 rare lipoprotein A [Candidatus Kryptobacter tengchongensis]
MRSLKILGIISAFVFNSCTSAVRYSTQDTSFKNSEKVQVGVASYYGVEFHGRPTTSGETYDMNALTAAHPTLPIGTLVKVTNLANNKSVIVRINDRGPFKKNRIIDVSYEAAKQLGFINDGTALVKIEVIELPKDGQDK